MKNDIRIDLNKLHPKMKYYVKKWIKACNKNKIYIIITEGYRTKERQDELYAQGRTTKGNIVTYAKGSDMQSQHQWGIAIDFAIVDDLNTKGKENVYDLKTMKKCASLAKKVGLAWGGDWKTPVDTPHLYLPDWGDTTTKLKSKYGNITAFKKTWTKNTIVDVTLFKHKSTLSKRIRTIYAYENTRVISIKGKWAHIEYKGKSGYVKSKYLAKID